MSTSREPLFSCGKVQAFVDDIEVVKGVDVDINRGEKHAFRVVASARSGRG
jgi:hypothetical protein